MTDVYQIIKRIRDGHNLTTRHLAMMSGIPPTTLESALQRQPDLIRIIILDSIANIWGMPWYALMTSSDDEDQVPRGKNPHFIPCKSIPDDDAERIVAAFLAQPLPEFNFPKRGKSQASRKPQPNNNAKQSAGADEHLRQSILFMLNKLNSDGLMDVMDHALAATKNPLYLRKEEPSCVSDNQQ